MSGVLDNCCGTRSSFGGQVLSLDHNAPHATFGRSARKADHEYIEPLQPTRCGWDSPGPAQYNVGQVNVNLSQNRRPSSPQIVRRAPFRNPASHEEVLAKRGPGTYNTDVAAFGKQVLARAATAGTCRIGTADRWSNFKRASTPQPHQGRVVEQWSALASWDGDSPAYTFSGRNSRTTFGYGSEMRRPTTAPLPPGPGSYEADTSAFGPQVIDYKPNMPKFRVPSATRERQRKMYISAGHERELLSTHSPGPGQNNIEAATSSVGRQIVSDKRSAVACKFGTSDRFSCFKPPARQPERQDKSLGPGSYVI